MADSVLRFHGCLFPTVNAGDDIAHKSLPYISAELLPLPQVKKGEKGIGILAPLVYRKAGDGEDAGEDNTERRVLRGFKVVHVFDVSQTEGEDLPQFAQITGEPGEKTGRMESLIRSHGIELQYARIPGGALGTSEGGKITVLPDLKPAERFAVLALEDVQRLAGHADPRTIKLYDRRDKAVTRNIVERISVKGLADS